MIAIEFHPEAEVEMLAAAQFYEQRAKNLGVTFLSEVEKSVHKISASPFLYPVLKRKVRRCLVQRFPYGILYVVTEDKIFVVAVMHVHRKPWYWMKRI